MWLKGFSQEASFTFRWAPCKDDRDFYHIWWESGKKNLSVGVCISLVGKARKYSFWRRWGWGSLWTLNFGRRGWGSSLLEQGKVLASTWPLCPHSCHLPHFELSLSFPEDPMGWSVATGYSEDETPSACGISFPQSSFWGEQLWKGS